MSKLTVLIDMDDTIEHLGKAWVEYLNERHGTSVQHDDLVCWDVSLAFPGLTNDQVYSPLYEDAFWKTVQPVTGASEVIKKLMDDGHDVYIVTASTWQTLPSKMSNVLFKYFPYLSWNQVIVTHNKQLIMGDILIDDAPHNLENGWYAKVLMDAPHNRSFDEESIGAVRMNNWSDIYDYVTSYGEQMEEMLSKIIMEVEEFA